MAVSQPLERLHSLDALRAAMMLLGLVLHSAISYITIPLTEAWPFQDRQTSALFDWLVFIIHLFRMPTFFVMAGFFAAFLYYREGPTGFLVHRTRRVLLPLAIAWLVIYPLLVGGFTLANGGGNAAAFQLAMVAMTSTPYAQASLAHLWFLYYLFIFCLAAGLVVPVLERLPATARSSLIATFGRLAPGVSGCFLFAMLSALSILPMSQPALDTSIAFIPAARVLVAYAIFFAFGWLLFLRQDIVSAFGRHPWRYVSTGLVASLAYMIVLVGSPFGGGWARQLPGAVAAGVATWLLIYGVTGVFVRYFEKPRPAQRYLSDASYWMYIIHLPVVIWLQAALAGSTMPALVKFAIVLVGVTLTTVVTYHYFVRATAIGAFLNGRRFQRALPRVAPAEVART